MAAPQRKTQVARATTGAVPNNAGGKVRAWLYSAESEGEAIAYLRGIETRHKDMLVGVDGAVLPARFDNQKVFYRVVAGGFPSWDVGQAWCNSLKKDAPGTFCKVLPAHGAAN